MMQQRFNNLMRAGLIKVGLSCGLANCLEVLRTAKQTVKQIGRASQARLLQAVGLTLLVFLWATPASADNTAQEFLRSGIAAFHDQNYAIAVDHFSSAIQQDSALVAAYADRCLSQIYLEQYQEAIADCSQALQRNPQDLESLLNRGLSYHRLQQYQEAITDFTQLLQLTPHDSRAYYNRALAQVELAAYSEAIVDYGQALRQTSPLDRVVRGEIYIDRGLAQLLQNHQQAAIGDFTQAIQFNATARAYYNRGCAYHQQGNSTAALNDFSQVLEQDPNYAQAYLSRGLIRHERGERQAAIGDLRQAAQYFCYQGFMLAYQQTLELLQKIQGAAIG
ncbi:tetratricopeptide repeat protein [Phormidium tenue FACHB-886]|nr:tetratricopeptide repeat protein [Phormidium tenue FACHB-886]